MLIQVLVASFVVQLFSLANPLLIQVIIDKVISQRSLDTLQVLGIALVVVTLLEGCAHQPAHLPVCRNHQSHRQRLGAEVIDHLLRLPLDYFDRRPVGELGTRMAELEKIRNFLTGQALTTVLDAVFSVIYIVVMVLYSWVLTLVALAVVPIQVALTVLGSLFRRQFRQAAEENARTQSHLVEVLTGIQTVKAQNVEMVSRWKWQDLYGRYIGRTFEKTITGTALTQTSQVLQNTLSAAGALGGGKFCAQRRAHPGPADRVPYHQRLRHPAPAEALHHLAEHPGAEGVVRAARPMWSTPPRNPTPADQAKIPLPPIRRRRAFRGCASSVSQKADHRFSKHRSRQLNQGTFVGIVGQSGSGKSTLMKLLPRLYSPDRGKVLIDDYDIDKGRVVFPAPPDRHRSPGSPAVLQASVAENIALTNPETQRRASCAPLRLACAHDFIMELP